MKNLMKNTMKKMICALTLAAVCFSGSAMLTTTASASGHDQQDVYVCDVEELVLYEEASYDSSIIFTGYGYNCELHVMEYLNGFGYCYAPDYDVNGWVDLGDTYYLETEDFSEKNSDDDDIIYDDADEFDDVLYSNVASSFLALRSDPNNDDSNIIAQIYENGTALYMTGDFVGEYGYCYVPALGMYGWVNTDYTI